MTMRDNVAKRRPMIDLEQFERRLRQTSLTAKSDEDPLAELARFVDQRDDPYKEVFERRPQPSPAAQGGARHGGEAAVESDFWPDPPQVFDDEGFAPSHLAATPAAGRDAYRAEAPAREAYPKEGRRQAVAEEFYAEGDRLPPEIDFGARQATDRRLDDEDALAAYPEPFSEAEDWRRPEQTSYADPEFESEPRSKRPLYIMAAIIVAGIAGIGASFALKGGSSSHGVASIKAVDGPAKVQPESSANADAPSQSASILERTPQAAPVAVADGSEQPIDLSHMPDRAPRVIPMTGASSGAASVLAPPPPGRVSEPAGDMTIANLIEPKKVKTVSVRPDGSVISTGVVATRGVDTHPAAVAPKPATPKSTARVAATPKPPADAETEKTARPKSAEVATADAEAVGGGAYAAQLAAPTSEAEARDIQAKLIKKYGSLIPGFHPSIRKAQSGGKTVYRVRSVGLSKEEAAAICQKVQGAGGACFVTRN